MSDLPAMQERQEFLDSIMKTLGGSDGRVDQLAAFRDLWGLSMRNVRWLRQAVLGAERFVADEAVQQELEAMAALHSDVLGWMALCAEQLGEIAQSIEPKEPMH